MDNITVQIPNFKLNIFRNLLDQSLLVNNQLMLQFSPDMIKGCSFSSTKSLVKLWTIPLENLIIKKEDDAANLFEQATAKKGFEFPVFDFYILKGDLFKKYLTVHNSDNVDLSFVLHNLNGKYQAAEIEIKGKSELNTPLITSFTLTTEDLISNKIDDYAEVIKMCTPSDDMFEFTMNDQQIQEIKRLIRNLHKALSNNTSFLHFLLNFETKKVTINDKVFSADFDLVVDETKTAGLECFGFNILKSDFVMTGNHTFSVYTGIEDQKVIMGARYAAGIIWCLTTKINENAISIEDESLMEASLDSMDLSEYSID